MLFWGRTLLFSLNKLAQDVHLGLRLEFSYALVSVLSRQAT